MFLLKQVNRITETNLVTSTFLFCLFLAIVLLNLFENMLCSTIKCIILTRKWLESSYCVLNKAFKTILGFLGFFCSLHFLQLLNSAMQNVKTLFILLFF